MKLLKIVVVAALIGCFIGCGSGKSTTFEDIDNLENMVYSKAFTIEAEWAIPMTTGSLTTIAGSGLLPIGSTINRINIQGQYNHLTVKGDSVSAYLPYYGERQMGGGYNSAQGVQFNGLAKDYSVVKNEKKNSQTVSFQVNNKTETYQVTATLYPNRVGQILVNSSQRFAIRYEGTITEIKEEGEEIQ
ncbi:DUF4251 domain-containing protein [Poritiphilus flavus]|uniref:DUF4251 domain-containing protein n=1 Tax=Poritiphilus flavus TaxID=2697053 RepID=A0A6L9EG51_9FLAO|nr:DUF4251 domain-containing protein [Poritiphilus flavus]NAS13671.1 DUF4251 domain-containing protein [Poritiphilus flavus]